MHFPAMHTDIFWPQHRACSKFWEITLEMGIVTWTVTQQKAIHLAQPHLVVLASVCAYEYVALTKAKKPKTDCVHTFKVFNATIDCSLGVCTQSVCNSLPELVCCTFLSWPSMYNVMYVVNIVLQARWGDYIRG